jgi:hypothetical protein
MVAIAGPPLVDGKVLRKRGNSSLCGRLACLIRLSVAGLL